MAKKIDYRKLTIEAIDEVGTDINEGTPEFEAAVKYVTEHWALAQDKQAAKDLEMSVKEYALNSIGNGLQDNHHLEYMSTEAPEPKEQEIIAVDQDEVKKALKALTTRENDFLAYLYTMHDEYNHQYFYGQLSHPFITIEKMSNKTLGNYTHGADAMGITNHIRFNRNFIALNQGENMDDPTRILETLRHEMIHQWQDEVLYMKEGVAAHQVALPVGFGSFLNKEAPATIKRTKDGKPIGEMVDQKSRPKEWHNRDFKEYAVVVDIPAKGDKCYGNPAIMPEGKSYNRKFQCECIASNGFPLTIWSTREVNAICTVCGTKFEEQATAGETVKVVLSHIEAPGEDGMRTKMLAKGFDHFERFGSKKERDEFVDELYKGGEDALEVEQGFYMKGNNAYKEGFTHWVAYKGDALPKGKKKPAAKAPVKKPAPKPAPKKEPVKAAPSEEPTVVEVPQKPDNKEKPVAPGKKAPVTRKAKVVKPVEVPAAPAPEVPVLTLVPDPEPPKEPTDMKRSHTNPQDLLDLYKETGSIKGVAEAFGMTSANVIYHAKKLGIDFKKGVIKDGAKA